MTVLSGSPGSPRLVGTTSPRRFLLKPGLFPLGGNIHLLGGAPYAGKSTLTAQLLQAVLCGGEFLGFQTEQLRPEEVGVVFTDRPDAGDWLESLGLQRKVPQHTLAGDPGLRKVIGAKHSQSVEGAEFFRYCLSKFPSTLKFLVADVFTTYFTGPDVHRARLVASNMNLLHEILKERDLAVLGLVYGLKQKNNESDRYAVATERIIGAAPLRGSASTIAYLTSEEESGSRGFQELFLRSRQAAPQHLFLQRSPATHTFQIVSDNVWDQPVNWNTTPTDLATIRAVQAIAAVSDDVEDGWTPSNAVRLSMCLNRSTFSERINRLKQLGLLDTEKRGKLLYLRVVQQGAES